MTHLLDTNIFLRLANPADPAYPVADRAVTRLRGRGDEPVLTAQNMVEFRSAATRPVAMNGLGLTAAEADAKAADFEAMFRLVPETPDVYPAWKAIVSALGVIGKTVHDAKLVAVCHVHGVGAILTFNINHFTRLTASGPPVVVIDPATV